MGLMSRTIRPSASDVSSSASRIIYLKHFLRQGRISLVIGIVFVTLCLLAADAIDKLGSHGGISIARESLTIVGWVAMWHPMQTFLYGWWPLRRQIRMYQQLGSAQVRVIQGK